MNKKELISHLAEQAGISNRQAETALNALTAAITDTVCAGGELVLHNIGKFSISDRKARMGHNPKTHQPVEIPAKRVPKFTPAKALKDAAAS